MSQSELVHSFFLAGGSGGDSPRHISQSTLPPHRATLPPPLSNAAAMLPSLARYEDGCCTQIEVREFPSDIAQPSIHHRHRVQSARMQTAVLVQDRPRSLPPPWLLPRLCRRLPFVYPSGAFNGGGENTAFPTGCLLANPSESEGS